MRSGVTFIVGSIALAWILTTVAVAAPLTACGATSTGSGPASAISSRASSAAWPAPIRASRAPPSAPRSGSHGSWTSSDSAVMTVAARRGYYMRTVTYDIYTGHGWSSSEGSDRRVAAGDRIFPAYTPERPLATDAFDIETVTVEIQGSVGRNIFTPGYPTAPSPRWLVHEPGGLPLLGALQSPWSLDKGKGYQITADISQRDRGDARRGGTELPGRDQWPPTSVDRWRHAAHGRCWPARWSTRLARPTRTTRPRRSPITCRTDPRFTYSTSWPPSVRSDAVTWSTSSSSTRTASAATASTTPPPWR